MKSALSFASLFFMSGAVMFAAPATNSPAAPPAPANGPGTPGQLIGFLPKTDQDRIMSAYNKAMAADEGLKNEGDDLMLEAQDLEEASPEDRQAFMEKVRSHREKVRQAMLKQDPTLAPVLDKIDKHPSEMRAQREKAAAAATGQ